MIISPTRVCFSPWLCFRLYIIYIISLHIIAFFPLINIIAFFPLIINLMFPHISFYVFNGSLCFIPFITEYPKLYGPPKPKIFLTCFVGYTCFKCDQLRYTFMIFQTPGIWHSKLAKGWKTKKQSGQNSKVNRSFSAFWAWNSLVFGPNLKEYPYGPDGSQAVGSHPVVLPPGHAGSERETDGFSATWHRRRTSSNSFFKSRLDLDRGCLSVTISACTLHTASLIQISKAVLDTKKLRWSLLRG